MGGEAQWLNGRGGTMGGGKHDGRGGTTGGSPTHLCFSAANHVFSWALTKRVIAIDFRELRF